MKKLIIKGSSRKDGDTTNLVNQLLDLTDWDVVDLNDYDISYYDYDHRNMDDDYLKLMQHIIENYDTLIFATPVYWYAMSGIMKKFFDRISDCLIIKKEIGRKLKGKQMAVICCGANKELKSEFYMPFIETANYLGMEYIGNIYSPC